MPPTPLDILRTVFGYPGFRNQQQAIVEHVAEGGDALVLMPTGGGKSLCYQIPALLRQGTGIVVSPLIALMQDQVDALRAAGVAAAYLNSSLDAQAQSEVERQLLAGELNLLYVAPERLLTGRFLGLLEQIEVALFAIDEAHCVSQWGHDFRPEYRELTVLHERFPHVPRIALTATADPRTREEIVERLALSDARQFVSSFDRPNIGYRVMLKHNPRTQLMQFLDGHRGEAGIIYALSRKKVDDTAAWLAEAGIEALPYHAGLDAATRAKNQQRFLREDGVVMVATVAFGMGIDKPDVRYVAHLDMPSSIEAYYQETGRAGRDGQPSEAFMTFGMGDVVQRRRMIEEGEAPEEIKRIERGKLDALLALCETTACRRQTILRHFGEAHPGDCGGCDNCLSPAETWDGSEAAIKVLAAIYRTGQRFGAGHIVDVLVGRETDKVLSNGHHTQAVFGKGDELDAKGWQSAIRQLTAQGFIAVDTAGFGALHLTEAARAVFRHERAVTLRKDQPRETRRALRRALAEDMPPPAAALFEALRAERSRLAKAQSVPPYVIFHDTTLRAMALARPGSVADMAELPGVGDAKLRRYGDAFLAVIRTAL